MAKAMNEVWIIEQKTSEKSPHWKPIERVFLRKRDAEDTMNVIRNYWKAKEEEGPITRVALYVRVENETESEERG